jgi:hypothetical protein
MRQTLWHNPCMPRAGKRDKFEDQWNEELRRKFGTHEPLRQSWDELRQTERWLPPFLSQLDDAAVFIFRDAWPRFTEWLRKSFPRAAEALPAERWAQIGWLALGVLTLDWVVSLGPHTGHNVTLLLGWGLAGYAGWQVWRRLQQVRRDELAQRFVQYTGQLGAAGMEQRIAALGALDQLAYDTPRYRLPLVHLLNAWLAERDPELTNAPECVVARKMVVEFTEMLIADAAQAPTDAGSAAADIAAAQAAAANSAATAAAAPPPATTAPVADAPPVLEVLTEEPPLAEPVTVAAELPQAAVGPGLEAVPQPPTPQIEQH